MSANPTLPVTYGYMSDSTGVPNYGTIIGAVNSAELAKLTPYAFPTDGNYFYFRNAPPGYPIPGCGAKVQGSALASPSRIPWAGQTINLFDDEAAALTAFFND